jgi:hypothetical protein
MRFSVPDGAMNIVRLVWRGVCRAVDLVFAILLFLIFGVGLTAESVWMLGLSDSELHQFGPIRSCAAGEAVRGDAPSRHLLLAILALGLGVTLWGAFELRKWLLAMRRQ